MKITARTAAEGIVKTKDEVRRRLVALVDEYLNAEFGQLSDNWPSGPEYTYNDLADLAEQEFGDWCRSKLNKIDFAEFQRDDRFEVCDSDGLVMSVKRTDLGDEFDPAAPPMYIRLITAGQETIELGRAEADLDAGGTEILAWNYYSPEPYACLVVENK